MFKSIEIDIWLTFSRILPDSSKPIVALEKVEVARRSSAVSTPAASNGDTNSIQAINGTINKKRTADDAGLDISQVQKRGKAMAEYTAHSKVDETIVLDDAGTGAIIIDDD
jgi:hypothetical protein